MLPQNIVQKVSAQIKSWISSEVAAQKSLLQVTDLPDWQELLVRCQSLPASYAEHFQSESVTDVKNLHGRAAELENLNQVLARWESGRACSVAVVGPEGSGKTSLLSSFSAMLADRHPILQRDLPHRIVCVNDLLGTFAQLLGVEPCFKTVEELTCYIQAQPPQVFILECGHNLTLRSTGCREALEAFFHILLETRHHWMWLVSFRRYPWERLQMTAGLQKYFTHQVTTLYHDQQQIREIIETRHAETSLRLEFLADEAGEAADGVQEELATEFFQNLFAATGGNIAAAFYYWLLSLAPETEADVIKVRPLGAIDAGYLRSLDKDYHFTMAEIVWHGGLSCQEHQELFMQSHEASRLQLEYLAQLSLLVTEGLDAEGSPLNYRLNPVYFKQVVGLLESLHLLY